MSKVILGKVARRARPNRTVVSPTSGNPPAIPDWVTYGTYDDGTTHDWLVPPAAEAEDLGLAVVSLFVHPTSGSPATAIGTVPDGWTLEGSASGTGALHYFYSKTLAAGDLASGQTFTITEGADAHVSAAWGVVKGNGQTVSIVSHSSVGGGIDLPAVSGDGTFWIVTMSSLNKGIPTGNDPDGAVSAGYTLAAYKSSVDAQFSNTYNAAVFVQKQRMDVVTSETPADLDWDWASPGRNSAGMTFAITGAAGTPDVAAGDHTHTESDITDLDHWTEADHDALDHTGLTGVGTDDDAIHDNVAGEISAITSKASPVSADLLLIEDSEASNAKKKITIGDLPGGSSSVEVKKAGSTIGTRSAINFIEGTDITLTVTDDSGNDEVDVTITSTASGGGGGGSPSLLHVRDEKSQNTAGGSFASGAWQTRVLNTVKTNEIAGSSLASNVITLPAGTYWVEWEAPAYRVGRHQTRLWDVDNSAVLVVGTSQYATAVDNTTNTSKGRGRFTLVAETDVRLEHRCDSTFNTLGFGVASNFTTEVYTDIRILEVT